MHYSGHTWGQLRTLVAMMIGCCEHPELHHSAVYEKYREKRFKEASVIVQDALDAGFTLPHHAEPVRRQSAPPFRFDATAEPLRHSGVPVSIQT